MSWDVLEGEIAAWMASGQTASLWWRDDDAIAATASLERLLGLMGEAGIPLALAVIPARVDESLARRLERDPLVTVLQHGYAHINHAAGNERAVECGGGSRPLDATATELSAGRGRLVQMFGKRFLPVLVPPWNRIHPDLPARLPYLGFIGLSTWGARGAREAAPDLVQVNSHADPIAWRRGRVFGGPERVLAALAGHLADKRLGRADPDEPTGLLTHHLAHDADGWSFLQEFISWTAGWPGLRWVAADEAFGVAPP